MKLTIATIAITMSITATTSVAFARTLNLIHVGGECSTQWATSGTGRNVALPGYRYYNSMYAGWTSTSDNKKQDWGPVGELMSPDDQVAVLDARLDNTVDIWYSVAQLAGYLDATCNNANVPGSITTGTRMVKTSCKSFQSFNGKLVCTAWNEQAQSYTIDTTKDCVIFDYSGGDNIVRKLLSMYDDRWNIRAVFAIAGAGGGTELASLFGASPGPDISNCDRSLGPCQRMPGDLLVDTQRWWSVPGVRCGFQNWMDVDTVRGGYGAGWWAFDDTNGRPIYHVFNTAPDSPYDEPYSYILPGDNDGAVAYHSSLGRADVDAFMFNHDVWYWQNIYGYPPDYITNSDYSGIATTGPNGDYYGHYFGKVVDMWTWPHLGMHWYMKVYGMASVAYIGPDCDWSVPGQNTCNLTPVSSDSPGWNANQYCLAGCNQNDTLPPL